MRLGFSPLPWRMGPRQTGFTLVEVLVGVTITVTVITAAVAVLSNVLASQNRMLRQTEQAEALRVASAWITRDARLAKDCRTPGDALRLVRTWTAAPPFLPLDYVDYRFYGRDQDGQEVFDPDHLHRWAYQGGMFVSEEIVGWNMAPFDPNNGTGTTFSCSFTNRAAQVQLEAKPIPGQSRGLSVLVLALQRNN